MLVPISFLVFFSRFHKNINLAMCKFLWVNVCIDALHCCGQLLRALTFPKVILAFTKSTLAHRPVPSGGDHPVWVKVDTWE